MTVAPEAEDSLLLRTNRQLVRAVLGAQNQQRIAERAQGDQMALLAVVAHELRNPLTPIRLAAELIDLSRQFIKAGATHLIYTCPQPYSAEGARWLWNEVVEPLRG